MPDKNLKKAMLVTIYGGEAWQTLPTKKWELKEAVTFVKVKATPSECQPKSSLITSWN
ncbi:hypothetical protein [Enterobacter sp. ENT03]|uniref:hypothetical protein n=1 Tax=Enterobacter sp. ENT03 TaxID=2854780 RepID=UPI001C48C705|nr:hypothetical protein [Enterobacter sp. ENT03]MBV7404432.1 hypothetical protein [Enterobacter sp. ENT03]